MPNINGSFKKQYNSHYRLKNSLRPKKRQSIKALYENTDAILKTL
jgi:hypothetical protein